MSDFDKEAEREKLRERFEKEDEQRAATEQMSELLLKGATMTNAHCSDCGDPIFRYDGQEFCPTCQKPITREQSESDDGTDEGDDQSADDDHIEVADPSDEARVQFGGDGETADAETADDAGHGDERSSAERAAPSESETQSSTRGVPSADPARTPDEAGGRRATDERRPSDRRPHAPDQRSGGRDGQPGRGANPDVSTRTGGVDATTGDVRGDLEAAESLLAETVRRFAERAAATDDPSEAREHLAAAREAAEALDAATF